MNQNSYFKDHCWQYDIRVKNFKTDLIAANLTKEKASGLKISDFEFSFVDSSNKSQCEEIKKFITRHEWLGKMPTRPTHRFIATYKGILAGVVVMATPNTFSNLLGEELRHTEKLISRGACISWSPKNLGSSLIMFSIRWMAKNTDFRFFTAYSDTEARELGTIYQACNFIYLGQNSGARFECFDPSSPELGYFSDRLFRRASFIKRKSIEAGIQWKKDWQTGEKLCWEKIPDETRVKIKILIEDYQSSCTRRALPLKHKYVYIFGRSKAETKKLKKIFYILNPTKVGLKYPKDRAPDLERKNNTATSDFTRPSRIESEELTKRTFPCWPMTKEAEMPQTKKLFSIKEITTMYGISPWLIYHHIKTDPTFPVFNVGIKKRFLIDISRFDDWLKLKTKKFHEINLGLISAEQLLEVK